MTRSSVLALQSSGAPRSVCGLTSVPYKIRRSVRARHARLIVDAAGVELVLPERMRVEDVEEWVESRRPWVERTLRRYEQAASELPPIALRDGGSVPYLGEPLELRVLVESGRKRVHVKRENDVLTAKIGRSGELEHALENWYRARAFEEIGPRLDAAVARAGRNYERLQIRAQKSRWGSCSSTGTLCFNWRLLMAPPGVLDYVVEHEVAHLDAPDHSTRFWAIVDERCPQRREHERWLKRYGSALHLA